MTSLFQNPVFVSYAIAATVICFNLLGLGFLTALTRAKRRHVINHEDVGVNPGAKVFEVEHADVARVKRAHMNAVEAAVPFLVTGFIFTQTLPNLVFARVLFGVFVVVRLLHSAFYVNAKQPFRTGSFVIGAITIVIMLVQVVRYAFAAE